MDAAFGELSRGWRKQAAMAWLHGRPREILLFSGLNSQFMVAIRKNMINIKHTSREFPSGNSG
jgi:hypothetical protein